MSHYAPFNESSTQQAIACDFNDIYAMLQLAPEGYQKDTATTKLDEAFLFISLVMEKLGQNSGKTLA